MVLKPSFVWKNGKFVAFEKAKVHVMTHALHYGSAAFEGIRAYKTSKGTAIFRLNEHVDRLFFSAKALGIDISYSKNQLKKAIISTVRKNKLQEAYVRPLIFYGYGNIGVYPKDVKIEAVIAAAESYVKAPRKLRVFVSRFRKTSGSSIVQGAKISGNYVNSILAMQDARKKGYDEALMLDSEGFVSEGPTENVLFVKNNALISPISKSTLYGITLDTLKYICRDLKIKFFEKKLKLSDAMKSDEAFFCGTGREISSIISINGKNIGIGNISGLISAEYHKIVTGENPKCRKWLTFL